MPRIRESARRLKELQVASDKIELKMFEELPEGQCDCHLGGTPGAWGGSLWLWRTH